MTRLYDTISCCETRIGRELVDRVDPTISNRKTRNFSLSLSVEVIRDRRDVMPSKGFSCQIQITFSIFWILIVKALQKLIEIFGDLIFVPSHVSDAVG